MDIYLATVPKELITWRPKDTTPSISTLSLASSHSSLHSETQNQLVTTPNTDAAATPTSGI